MKTPASLILVLIILSFSLSGEEKKELKYADCWSFNISTRVKTTNVEVSRIFGPFLLTVRVVNKEGIVRGEDVPLWQEFGVMAGFIINTRFLSISAAGGYGINLIDREFYNSFAGEASCFVYLFKTVGLGVQALVLPEMGKEGWELTGGISFRIK